MTELVVTQEVPLRPDPDPNAQSNVTLAAGDRVSRMLALGEWVKVQKGANSRAKRGWVQAIHLREVVGITVKLHPEPLSEDFTTVTGEIEEIAQVADWKKVQVTADDGTVLTGWINVAADDGGVITPPPVQPDTPSGPDSSEAQLHLGINEIYLEPILKASQITQIDAAALAALIDAEADKITSGPNRGQWNRNSLNNSSGAGGLTQFLRSTWIAHAKNTGHLLNGAARSKGFINAQNRVVDENGLLALRFDPELSIVSAAEFGIGNLKFLDQRGVLPPGLGDDDKARYIYLAHHEGAAGAELFLKNQNSASFEKFVAQVGRTRAAAMVEAAGGDVALAYRIWLNNYMDEKIRPDKFRRPGSPGSGPGPGSGSTTAALARFDGPPIPMSLLGGATELVLEMQQVLSRYGYVDPPADGRFGPVSIWGLREFCALNDLSLSDGFTRDIARALINPQRVLPEIKRTGTWFDKVVAFMKTKDYWMCRHPRCANIIYLEGMDANGTLNDDRPNVFNDLRVVCFIDASGMPNLRSWEGTTEPGTFWTVNPMNPGGAARIAFNQYKSWIVGTHHAGQSGAHEALVQVQPVSVHRDLNKDYKRTSDRIDTGLFGINQHWGYDAPKDDLGRTSAGCLVGRTKAGHRDFMALIKADPRFHENPGYKFISTILPADIVLG